MLRLGRDDAGLVIFEATQDEEERREAIEIGEDLIVLDLAIVSELDRQPLGTPDDRSGHIKRGARD